jgi:hypothetical protein
LDLFPENLGELNEEQGDVSTQTLSGNQILGWWNVNMMGEYCWTLHQEIPETSHRRSINIRSFAGNRKRQYKAIK